MDKLRKYFHEAAEAIEVLMAVFVFIAIVIGVIGLIPQIGIFWQERGDSEALMLFLRSVLSIVIASEFVSMLCRPSAENVTEVLIFLIARHMVVLEMTAAEDLLLIVSIAILFVLQRFIRFTKDDSPLIARLRDRKNRE